jgi:hypothetical protein
MIIEYKIQALLNLVPNSSFCWSGNEWENLTWLDTRPCPTKEAWEAEKARLIAYQPKQDCKDKAKSLLANSDWSTLPDVQTQLSNYNDFVAYRSQLRELVINPVENPVFPSEPEAKWK